MKGANTKVFDQVTAVAFPGSSGGGMFLKANGEYIGMLTQGVMKLQGFNFIVPLRRINAWAKEAKVEWAIDHDCEGAHPQGDRSDSRGGRRPGVGRLPLGPRGRFRGDPCLEPPFNFVEALLVTKFTLATPASGPLEPALSPSACGRQQSSRVAPGQHHSAL